MLSTFRRTMALYSALLPGESKAWIVVAAIGSFFVAGLDMLGVAATMPLMLVATDAPQADSVFRLFADKGVHGTGTVLIILAVAIGLLFIVKSVLTVAFRYWVVGRTQFLNARAATVVLKKYADSDYAVHRTRDAADIQRQINMSVMQVFVGVLTGYITLIVDVLTLALILAVLVAVSPWGTLVAFVVFGGTMLFSQRVVREKLRRAGEINSDFGRDSWAALIPIVDGFREVRLSRSAGVYVGGFEKGKIGQGKVQRTITVLTELPRYVLEIALIVGIGMIAGVLTLTGSEGTMIAVLGVFTAAAARMLPTLQRVGTSLATIRTSEVGITQLEGLLPTFAEASFSERAVEAQASELVGDIELVDVGFRYPDAEEFSVRDVNARIPFGSSVAFVGSSGAGKSTLLDVILGLFEPTEGQVLANGHSIHASLDSWLRTVGVVSQDVYLVNDTVRANIAFGRDPDSVDDDEVLDAMRRAQLLELLEDLPNGLDTQLGERGVRISGGQRQRIGIARALFKNPQVLVLDEATSALDNITEQKITETIESLAGDLTIILVAHRLSTIRHADSIIFMDAGSVAATGTFDEVTEQNQHFAELVRLGKLV